MLQPLVYLEAVKNYCSGQVLGPRQDSLEDQALSKLSQGHRRTHNWDYSSEFLLSWKHTSLIKDISTQPEHDPLWGICLHGLGNFNLFTLLTYPSSQPYDNKTSYNSNKDAYQQFLSWNTTHL